MTLRKELEELKKRVTLLENRQHINNHQHHGKKIYYHRHGWVCSICYKNWYTTSCSNANVNVNVNANV